MAKKLMQLQDQRKEILKRYRNHEIQSKEAIRLLRENDDAVAKIQKKR